MKFIRVKDTSGNYLVINLDHVLYARERTTGAGVVVTVVKLPGDQIVELGMSLHHFFTQTG